MTNHSEGGTPRSQQLDWAKAVIEQDTEGHIIRVAAAIVLDELSAARSALAEKEREVEQMKNDFDLLAADTEILNKFRQRAEAAEARAAETDRLLREVRSRWQWKGPSREENFEIMLREIDRALAAPPASPAGRKE